MSWTTLYITGKTDFREDVRRSLDHADIPVMPGYIQPVDAEQIHDLYWIGDNVSIKEFKKAIGSKIIWKHRLHFFKSLEEFVEYKDHFAHKSAPTMKDLDLTEYQ